MLQWLWDLIEERTAAAFSRGLRRGAERAREEIEAAAVIADGGDDEPATGTKEIADGNAAENASTKGTRTRRPKALPAS